MLLHGLLLLPRRRRFLMVVQETEDRGLLYL